MHAPIEDTASGAPQAGRPEAGRFRPRPWHGIWILLLSGWAVSAADRAVTGPVVTWMIGNGVGFLADARHPHALGGLIGGLFFAGYLLTQFPGGHLGDRYGHRTLIVVSLLWAGAATAATGLAGGLVAFVVLRVATGLGEGAFFSNDRALVTEVTPERERSLGMGVVLTGLAIGITAATVFTPDLIALGRSLLPGPAAWRMAFWVPGAATAAVGAVLALRFRAQLRMRTLVLAALHLAGYAAVALALVMGVFVLGDRLGLSNPATAVVEVGLAAGVVAAAGLRGGGPGASVVRDRDLLLIGIADIAILWNLWFFGFWSVSIVAGAARSSFAGAALTAGFTAGAGVIGFPAGGLLSDAARRRGWTRKAVMLWCTGAQGVLTAAFAGYLQVAARPSLWVMGGLLFSASLFFNALQPVGHAWTAELAPPALRGAAFGMQNLIGEIGAVLAPAVGGALRDGTGGWTVAVWLDAVIVLAGFGVLAAVRGRRGAGA